MRLGIDSYSFHRYFGEIYDEQADPGVRWTLAGDFLPYAVEQEVEEVALDLQFFPAVDTGYCDQLRAQLDDAGLDRVVGWGHPDGLHAGTSEEALLDLEQSIPIAPRVGARTMRIVSSSYIYVDEPHGPQIVRIVRMLKGAVEVARSHDVVLASREPYRLHIEGDRGDHRAGRFGTSSRELRHRQYPSRLRGPGRGSATARALHRFDAHEGPDGPRARRLTPRIASGGGDLARSVAGLLMSRRSCPRSQMRVSKARSMSSSTSRRQNTPIGRRKSWLLRALRT